MENVEYVPFDNNDNAVSLCLGHTWQHTFNVIIQTSQKTGMTTWNESIGRRTSLCIKSILSFKWLLKNMTKMIA